MDTPTFTLPEDLSVLGETELAALLDAATAEATALGALDSFSTIEVDRLTELADAMDAIRGAQAALAEATADLAARRDAALARVTPVTAPAADVAPVEPVAEPVAIEPEAVVAATEPKRPNARIIVANAPKPVVAPAAASGPAALIASAADVPDVPGNTTFATLADAVPGMLKRFATYPQSAGKPRQQHGLLRIQPQFPAELIATGMDDHRTVNHALNTARLPGGSLVAAGGWCAPTPQTYDICTTGKVNGIYSLPEVQVPRGSLSYFRGIDYAAITAQLNALQLCYTNAELEVEPPVEKECIEIDCPTPVSMELDACVLCVRAGILQQKAFPEYVTAWLEQALVVHAHRMNRRDILAAVGLATETATIASTFGAISQLMDAIELRAVRYRYLHGLDDTDTLEVVLPDWIVGALRSDYIRRNTNEADDLARAQITAHFANRNVVVQWVRDWQDAAFLGAAPGPIVWPGTAQFLMYQAGALWRGVADVINVDTLYDSALLTTNRYQALFIEQGSKVALGCGGVSLTNFSICPSGATAGYVAVTPGTAVCPMP